MGDDHQVRVFIREQTPYGADDRLQEFVEHLRRLDADGTVGDVTITGWGVRAPRPASHASEHIHDSVRETIAEFETWAGHHEQSLTPAFSWYDRSRLTDENWQEPRLPLICVAVYEGDNLLAVFPSRDDRSGDVYSVPDGIARLEANVTLPHV